MKGEAFGCKAIAEKLKSLDYIIVSISRGKSEVGDLIYQADVTDKATVFKIVNEIVNRFGKIDVLVNNAGRFRFNDKIKYF